MGKEWKKIDKKKEQCAVVDSFIFMVCNINSVTLQKSLPMIQLSGSLSIRWCLREEDRGTAPTESVLTGDAGYVYVSSAY